MAQAQLLDASGIPLRHRKKARADISSSGLNQATMGVGSYQFPYNASEWATQEMGDWLPWIRSPDSEINMFRDRMVSRSRDLARNDGWISGGVNRILDNTVGTRLRLSSSPDYRSLAIRSGVKAFDHEWANEFRQVAEALWRGWSEGVGHYNDVTCQMTIGQQFRLAMRHKLIDGEGLGLMFWLPERVGYGGADYATALLLVDPDRLSNPYQAMDSKALRGGIEIDDHGVPVAYHIREAQQNDWYLAAEANTWVRVESHDEDGWQRVIHDFDRDRAAQHRGIGVFTPILAHAKMLSRYYGTELQAASIAATFGTYVTSPYDPAMVQDSLGGLGEDELPLYQSLRSQWANERPALLNGARVPTLFPGEEINAVASTHPNGNFKEFTHEMQRTIAAALGLSAEQVTQDWSQTNYSSARAALLEAWKTLTRRKDEFTLNFASPVYAGWLGEAMDKGELPLPAGSPAYIEARSAYSRCSWLGVPRGWVDPTKEPAGSILRMEGAMSTLRQECAEQGLDYEEVIHQRAVERKMFDDMKLPQPEWADTTAMIVGLNGGGESE